MRISIQASCRPAAPKRPNGMLERQREGIARAKAEGKYRGRAPTARAKAEQVRKLRANGVGASEIARRLGIGRASVYRALEA